MCSSVSPRYSLCSSPNFFIYLSPHSEARNSTHKTHPINLADATLDRKDVSLPPLSRLDRCPTPAPPKSNRTSRNYCLRRSPSSEAKPASSLSAVALIDVTRRDKHLWLHTNASTGSVAQIGSRRKSPQSIKCNLTAKTSQPILLQLVGLSRD